MAAARILGLALGLAGLLAVTGCGSGASTSNGAAAGSTAAAGRRPAPTTSAALAALRGPADVWHTGLRRVELFDENGVRSLAYRERVASDGDERFSLRPTEALTPVSADWTLRQMNREGFLFRYRDFAVRQPAWFASHYEVQGPRTAQPVAGRAVDGYRVERREGTPLAYELWVDRESGLPLRVEELGQGGVLRSRVEYESLELAAPLGDEIWFQGVHDERTLELERDLAPQVERAVPTPSLLPAGFRLLEASTLTDAAGPWVKLTYSDGVETVFFLHQPPAAGAAGAGEVLAGDVLLYRMGTVGVAQATLAEGTFLAVGKIGDQELVDVIESALP